MPKIQFKRKKSTGIGTNKLSAGEPLYNLQDKKLYIGGNVSEDETPSKHLTEVGVSSAGKVSIGAATNNDFTIAAGTGIKVTGNASNRKITVASNPTIVNNSEGAKVAFTIDGKEFAHTIAITVPGEVESAKKLTNERTIALSGAITGSTTFDGSANKTISTTYAISDSKSANKIVRAISTNSDGKLTTTKGTLSAGTGIAINESGNDLEISADTDLQVLSDAAANEIAFSINGKEYKKSISVDGVGMAVDSADKWTNGRKITLSKDASGEVTIDGSKDVNLAVTVANSEAATKLSKAVTITLEGDVAGSASFDGSEDAKISTTVASAGKLKTPVNINLTGDVTGSVSFDGSADADVSTTVEASEKLKTARTIELSGAVTGSTTFDGSSDKTISTTYSINDSKAANKVSRAVSVDKDGKLTTTKGTLIAGDGVTITESGDDLTIAAPTTIENKSTVTTTGTTVAFDINGKSFSQTVAIDGGSMSVDSARKWTTARKITLKGDASGEVSIDGSGDVDLTVTVADNSHNHTITGTGTDGLFDVTATGGNNSVTVGIAPYSTAQTTKASFDTSTTVPSLTTRLNYNGDLYATNMYATKDGAAKKVILEGDSRLSDSRTPKSHDHGNINNNGTLDTASVVVVTDSNKYIKESTVTTAELSYLSGTTSKIQDQFKGKAPTSHATTATTYGVSTESNYGHSKASGTSPKMAGTAAVGSEISSFARGDHVHPTDTSRASSTHTHGNIANDGKLSDGTTVKINRAVITDGNGKITVSDITSTELGYLDGVTSNLQDQIDNKLANALGTANSVVVTDAAKKVVVSNITTTELGHLAGVTSGIQNQINGKAPKSHASSSTDYGVASATNYGHAKASNTSPKANGTAATGSETSSFARGDHVHPTDTTRASSTHGHGNITNLGELTDGTTVQKDRAVITDANGKVVVSAITSTELGYLDGVTSNIQTQFSGKSDANHIHGNIANDGTLSTANRAVITDANKKITVSDITATELNYLDGVTSNLQTQLNNKASSAHKHKLTTTVTTGAPSETVDCVNISVDNGVLIVTSVQAANTTHTHTGTITDAETGTPV